MARHRAHEGHRDAEAGAEPLQHVDRPEEEDDDAGERFHRRAAALLDAAVRLLMVDFLPLRVGVHLAPVLGRGLVRLVVRVAKGEDDVAQHLVR